MNDFGLTPINHYTTYTYPYRTSTEFDNMMMSSDGEVLTGLWFDNSADLDKKAAECECQEKDLPIFREATRWLDIYFNGEQPDWTPAYRIDNLTPFRKEVIDIMLGVPFGKTMTYGEIAARIAGSHGIRRMSAQAVGGAVGWNPLCIIVPCHRIVGSNQKLTGYGGGIKNKIALLKNEGLDIKD